MSAAFARPGTPMCLAMLHYHDMAAIDAQMQAHVDWLAKGFAAGVILVAGRRDPRTGGVVVLRGDKASVEAVAATDPFVASGAASVEVIAFSASFTAPALADLLR